MNCYRKGRIAKRKVANDLKHKGFKNIRLSAGSRGPADIYARKGTRKYYVQVKSGSARMSRAETARLRAMAREGGGVAVGIRRNAGRNRWKFFGNWS